MPTEQYLNVVLLLLVSIAAINDLATRRIPNRLLLAALACALVLHALSFKPGSSLLAGLGGMFVGLAVFLPFYVMRGMAAGDVKLMAVIGALTGPGEAFEIAVVTWCAGGVMALLLVLMHGRMRMVMGNLGRLLLGLLTPGVGMLVPTQEKSAGSMPYGLAIAVGTMTVLARHYG